LLFGRAGDPNRPARYTALGLGNFVVMEALMSVGLRPQQGWSTQDGGSGPVVSCG